MNQEIFPENWDTYKIGHSIELLSTCTKLYEYVEANGYLKHESTKQSKPIRAIASFSEDRDKKNSSIIRLPGTDNILDPEFARLFEEVRKVIGYDLQINLFHLEELTPSPEIANISNTSSRLPNIVPSNRSNMFESEYSHGAALWHFDNAQPLNNMVIMVYLDYIDGGTCIADPVVTPVRDTDAHRQTNVFNKQVYTEDIRYTEVIGGAGTFACFNSHLLHRAGIPTKNFRRVVMINTLPKEFKYFAPKYRDTDMYMI